MSAEYSVKVKEMCVSCGDDETQKLGDLVVYLYPNFDLSPESQKNRRRIVLTESHGKWANRLDMFPVSKPTGTRMGYVWPSAINMMEVCFEAISMAKRNLISHDESWQNIGRTGSERAGGVKSANQLISTETRASDKVAAAPW